MKAKDFIRFFSHIRFLENGCWQWIAFTSPKGYGRFCWSGVQGQAHRFSYQKFVGRIPDGMTIDHLCRNRACVNPAHLEAVTNKINVLRGNGACSINKQKTHCKYGHEFSKDNVYVKIDNRYGSKGRDCIICRRNRHKLYYDKHERKN